MSPGAYPTVYRAIDEMVPDVALETKTARAVARKAGLRSLPGVSARVRTVLDAWIIPNMQPFLYQWLVDLSGMSKVRFTCQAADSIQVYYSSTLSGGLDPGDFEPWFGLGTFADFEAPGLPLYWSEVPPERAAPLRIAISSRGDDFNVAPFNVPEPFSMQVEGF